jgi:hypothetical protein
MASIRNIVTFHLVITRSYRPRLTYKGVDVPPMSSPYREVSSSVMR